MTTPPDNRKRFAKELTELWAIVTELQRLDRELSSTLVEHDLNAGHSKRYRSTGDFTYEPMPASLQLAKMRAGWVARDLREVADRCDQLSAAFAKLEEAKPA